MCLPQDVVPSLRSVGKATSSGSNATQWAVDQRPFVWVSPAGHPPADKEAPGSERKTQTEGFHPAIPLPDTGSGNLGGEDGSFLTLACADRSVETPPLAKDGEVLQSKVWVQAPGDGREAAAATRGPLFCSLPRFGEGHMDVPQQSVSRDAFASSCKSSLRSLTLPIVRENSLLAGVPSPRDVWDSPRSEPGARLPWAEEDRLKQSPATKRKLRSGTPGAGKTLSKAHHKATDGRRSAASKRKESASPTKDVSMSDSLSDDEDQSEDDEEDRPAMTEKRRRRMLSNRASAQRSRLRRQERLDTLEVLVAELRVENAALVWKANTALAKAKKFEDENKRLLDRVGRLEGVPLSDSMSFNELSGTRIENSVGGPARNLVPSYTQEVRFYRNYTLESLGSSASNRGFDESLENPKQPYQRWNNSILGGSFDFDFGSDPTDDASKPLNITPPQDKMECNIPDNSLEMNVSNLYQSEIMGLAQPSSFEGVDPFGMDIEQCSQEMDRVNLQPRYGEDVWLESLSDRLK